MQSSPFPSRSRPCASDFPLPLDLFPNAPLYAPIFSGREKAADSSSRPNAPFFSEFDRSFADAARRLTAPTAEVRFDRGGFATLDDFARRFERPDGVSSKAVLFADDADGRFLLVAPTPTFRLLFDAALGFDVAEICANETLWNDFNADVQTPSTSFEEEAFAQELARFASLSPFAFPSSSANVSAPESAAPCDRSDSPDASVGSSSAPPRFDAWRPVSFLQSPTRAAFELDDSLLYWERREIRLANRLFPWTLVFSTRFLALLADAATTRASSASGVGTPRPVSSPLTSPPRNEEAFSPFASPSQNDAPRFSAAPSVSSSSPVASATSSFELAIVVERGEMTAESWRRLKPGDVLTTDVPANALFLGLVDDAPRFLCRPGLFRGAAAVQIKSRADDGRE